jgi:hypothetical protein
LILNIGIRTEQRVINMINGVNSATTDKHQPQYKKQGFLVCAGGVVAGSAVAASIPIILVKKINPKIFLRAQNLSSSLNAGEFAQVNKVAEEALVKTGLAEKGVAIVRVTTEHETEVIKILEQEVNAKFLIRFLPKAVKQSIISVLATMIAYGNNAGYAFLSKKILIPQKDLSLSAFHEMGHAANSNLSKIGRLLLKCKYLTILAIPIALIALCKTKKAPGEKPEGAVDKTTDFIKNNAGKLTFLAFIPKLAEEAMASIKGCGFAKNVLDIALYKKVVKTNKIAYLTYLGWALAVSVGIALGVKVKDAIAKPKLVQHS